MDHALILLVIVIVLGDHDVILTPCLALINSEVSYELAYLQLATRLA